MKIFFSGGGGAGAEALNNLLSLRYDLYFGDASPDSIDPVIQEHRRLSLPWASEDGFVERIVELCKRYEFDFFVPGVDEELSLLAAIEKDVLPTRLFLPANEHVTLMLDKLEMIQYFENKSVQVPSTKKASEGLDGISFPCIAKPRKGRGSRGVTVLRNSHEAECFVEMIADKAEEYVLQEKMDGIEYTVQMIADEAGRLRAIVPVKVLYKRGITISAVVDPDDSVIDMCCRLHEVFPAKACYNIQLILSDDGLARPFEINPRVSTTFCLAIASGIDPFCLYLGDNTSTGLIIARQGITLRRYWKNVINNCFS
ncbi:MAG: ATP-grasp domain-containing protein [Clostridia bacterium]|nr:ATP-grasp domain-containing protein [Clostridia bacterium]